jgi:predicted nucleic acid-binding protein
MPGLPIQSRAKPRRPRGALLQRPVAARWGALSGASEVRGVPLPVIAGLIAATSLQHSLVVATRNTGELERCGARCFNPWLAP